MKKINVVYLNCNKCCFNAAHLKQMMDHQKQGAFIPYTPQEESVLSCFNIHASNCFCFKPINECAIIWISLDDCKNIEQFEEEFIEEFDNYKL